MTSYMPMCELQRAYIRPYPRLFVNKPRICEQKARKDVSNSKMIWFFAGWCWNGERERG
jgi:hypothetical protein